MALVLDDFLHQVKLARQAPSVAQPSFGLEDVESLPLAKEAIATIVKNTMTKYGSQVFTKPNFLLVELGGEIYGEPFVGDAYSGLAIRPEKIPSVLRKVLELDSSRLSACRAKMPTQTTTRSTAQRRYSP